MKTYYFINDDINPDTIYGSAYPYCMEQSEVDQLSREWGVDLYEQMHEATESEIAEYGVCED